MTNYKKNKGAGKSRIFLFGYTNRKLANSKSLRGLSVKKLFKLRFQQTGRLKNCVWYITRPACQSTKYPCPKYKIPLRDISTQRYFWKKVK